MSKTETINRLKHLCHKDLSKAVKKLLTFTENSDYQNQAIMQSGSLHEVESNSNLGTITESFAAMQRAKIRQAVLYILDQMEEDNEFEGKQIFTTLKPTNGVAGTTKTSTINGDKNIVLQNINGSNISVNVNDTDKIAELLQELSEKQAFELKQQIGEQNSELLARISALQQQFEEKKFDKKAENLTEDIDDFLKEVKQGKIEKLKERILRKYKFLHEYEDMLIVEKDPITKSKYEADIGRLKSEINELQDELKNI